jgi:hypothetical protein
MIETTARQAPIKRFMTIAEWVAYSGMLRSSTYVAIGRKHIKAVKMGRSVRVDTASGDNYLDELPAANIRAPAA